MLYIGPDDVNDSKQLIDYTRLKTERDESGKLTTPMQYEYIGEISFMRPEFIKMAKDKFGKKKMELESLLKWNSLKTGGKNEKNYRLFSDNQF